MKKLLILLAFALVSITSNAQLTNLEVDSALLVEIYDGVYSDYIIKTYNNYQISYALTGVGLFLVSDSVETLSKLETEYSRLLTKIINDSLQLKEAQRKISFYWSMKNEYDSILRTLQQ